MAGKKKFVKGTRAIDISGQKFGMLTTLYYLSSNKQRRAKWKCKCDCGNEIEVIGCSLRSGKVKNCGCIAKNKRGKEPAINTVISQYKRYREWKLDRETAISFFESNCFYCGTEPNNKIKYGGGKVYKYNGIDRVDSNKDYVSGNCLPACFNCNRMKSNKSLSDFIGSINNIYVHLHKNSEETLAETPKMKLAILNGSIITSEGDFIFMEISKEQAVKLTGSMEIDSYVGHQGAADLLSNVLGESIIYRREELEQRIGQMALVFKLKKRAPEGVVLTEKEIEKIGYEFGILYRLK